MRHRIVGRTLGRNSPHRTSMYRNMFVSLIQHERIITTEPKAKELRRFAEKLITIAKRGLLTNDPIKLLHARRQILSRLGPVGKVEFVDDKGDLTNDNVLHKLFSDIALRYKDRPGGYTRIIKRHERRSGRCGSNCIYRVAERRRRKSARQSQERETGRSTCSCRCASAGTISPSDT